MTLAHLPQVYRTKRDLDCITAYVAPVYKSESQHFASNYRPISLTSTLLEHVIPGDILENIEQVQDQAVRFIAGVKGSDDVKDTRSRLFLCIKGETSDGVFWWSFLLKTNTTAHCPTHANEIWTKLWQRVHRHVGFQFPVFTHEPFMTWKFKVNKLAYTVNMG